MTLTPTQQHTTTALIWRTCHIITILVVVVMVVVGVYMMGINADPNVNLPIDLTLCRVFEEF